MTRLPGGLECPYGEGEDAEELTMPTHSLPWIALASVKLDFLMLATTTMESKRIHHSSSGQNYVPRKVGHWGTMHIMHSFAYFQNCRLSTFLAYFCIVYILSMFFIVYIQHVLHISDIYCLLVFERQE